MGALGILLCVLIIVRYLPSAQPPPHRHLTSILTGINMRPTKYKPFGETTTPHRNKSLLVCMLMLCGDIQSNLGPAGNAHIYPCSFCEQPVTWEHVDGLCCDGCDVWHHRSCIELCSADYDLLVKHSHIQWLYCKCDSINVSSFTFHSFELSTSNMYDPLSHIDLLTLSHQTSYSALSMPGTPPGSTSNQDQDNLVPRRQLRQNQRQTSPQFFPYTSEKKNLRIMNINCRSIVGKSSEFLAALNYIKPDIVCGTESWLKGMKPGKPPTPDAIQSSEVFPSHYKAYRNDRGTLGGGVFVLVHQDLVAEEKAELVTNCEMVWVQVKLKGNKTLLVPSFYMPHRNMSDVAELRRSLDLAMDIKERHVIVAGDFNCPDIDWDSLSLQKEAQDKEVQQALLDLSVDFNLTQVQDKPTRENNLLDLTFKTNPSLIKSTVNAPGISDHDIVVVDSDTKPFYAKQRPRKCFVFSKANWDKLKTDIKDILAEIVRLYRCGSSVQKLWDTLTKDLLTAINSNIPSKLKTSKHSVPWINREVKRTLRRKARLFKKAKKKPNNWTSYRKCQKECKQKLRKAEWNHINKVINEGLRNNNTKPFWNYAKSKREDNIGIAPLKSKGKLVSNPKERAELLVDQFQSVFTKAVDHEPPSVSSRVEEDIHTWLIGKEGVFKLLNSIKVDKAAGPDELPNRVLQECARDSNLPKISRLGGTTQWLEKRKCSTGLQERGSSHSRALPACVSHMRAI